MDEKQAKIIEDMDIATVEAYNEFEAMIKDAKPAELAGMHKLIDWIGKWYLKAGYKRLCRQLMAYRKSKLPPSNS